jgi:hypothetical protein
MASAGSRSGAMTAAAALERAGAPAPNHGRALFTQESVATSWRLP